MQYANDVYAIGQGFEEDNVPTEGKAAKSRRQFFAGSAHHWLRSPKLKFLVQSVYPAIRFGEAVLCDKVPDLQDVSLCLRPTRYARHLRDRCFRCKASASFRLDCCSIPLLARAAV